MDLKAKGFEEELALDLVNTGKASYVRRLHDSYLPLFHGDGQVSTSGPRRAGSFHGQASYKKGLHHASSFTDMIAKYRQTE